MSRGRSVSRGIIASEVLNLAGEPIRIKPSEVYENYIPFSGTDGRFNAFPQEVAEIIRGSATLHSIIQSKANYVAGDDIQSESEKTLEYLSEVNNKGESLQDVYFKAGQDFEGGGNAYFQIVKKGDRVNIFHVDWTKCRLSWDNKTKKTDGVYLSLCWPEFDTSQTIKIPLYPNFATKEGVQRSIIHCNSYEMGFEFYGIPDWIGGQYYAQMESKIGTWNNARFDNSFVPSGILEIMGSEAGDEDPNQFIRRILKKFTGKGNQAKILALLKEGKDDLVSWTPLKDENDGSWLDLKEICTEEIVKACAWFPSLAGISTPGKLGNNQELNNAFDIAIGRIKKVQDKFNRALSPIFEAQGLGDFEIINDRPTSDRNSVDVKQILTINEQRQILGLGEIDNGDILINSNDTTGNISADN